MLVSVIIPAYREGDRIGDTVRAVERALEDRDDLDFEIIVVDDGSPDATAARAGEAGARVIRQSENRGKGAALTAGFREAKGDILVMLDGDVGQSGSEVIRLLQPVLDGSADMSIGVLTTRTVGEWGNGEMEEWERDPNTSTPQHPNTPTPKGQGGFGLVMALARWGMRRAGCPALRAPLSGQRAMTRALWERIGRFEPRFGAEMGLNLDAHVAGSRTVEVETNIGHRVTGRDWAGFVHRGRQFRDILRALFRRRGMLTSGKGERTHSRAL